MKNTDRLISIFGSIAFLIVLLLDSNTALQGAKDGIKLCINSVIPSLFPFLVFSYLLNTNIIGIPIKALSYIGKLCKIPEGYESVLIPGYLGGYPVGAQSINEAYKNYNISGADGRRLLGFCNNAGPAFIFGIGSMLFDNKLLLWIIWLIHISASLIVGMIIPVKENIRTVKLTSKSISISDALTRGLHTMATICGWVILFRILAAILKRWLLASFAKITQTSIIGLLELTNGCCDLIQSESVQIRFILFSCFINFGGICVAMQTVSVTKDVGIGYYFPGKTLQCSIAYFLTLLASRIVFPANMQIPVPMYVTIVFLLILIINIIFIKNSSNQQKNVV